MADFEKVYSIRIDTKQAERSVLRFQKRIESFNRTIVKLGVNTTKAFALITSESRKSKRAFGSLSKASDKLGRSLKDDIGKKGVRSIRDLRKESMRAEKRITQMGRSVSRASGRLKKFSKNFFRYVSVPIAAGGVASLKFARDFDKGMAKIATLIPGQTTRVKELGDQILKLSTESGVSLGDLTEGVYANISAWGDNEQTIERMNLVVKASQAGYASTEETLNLLASITETYGDNTLKATEHLSDLAFVTNKLAIKAPFAEMASSMPKVANVAKELNVTQEELFATMTAAAGVTGNVTEVSTQMRSVFTALTKETPLMESAVESINKEFKTNYKTVGEAIGNEKIGLMGFLERLKGGTKNSKEFQKALGGRVEGLNLAMALTGSRAGKYNEALDEMINKTGQTATAHKEVTDGVDKTGFAFDKMIARIKVLSVRIGRALIPAIEKFMDTVEPLIKHFEGMDAAALDFWITIGKWAVLFGAGSKLMVGLNMLGPLTAGAGTAAAGATPKILSLAGAWGVLGAAIAGAAAGYALFETVVEPHEKKRAGLQDRAKYASKDAERIAKTGTLEQKKEALVQVQKDKQQLLRGQKGASEIIGSILSPIETGKARGEQQLSLITAEQTLQASIGSQERSMAERRELLSEGGTMTRGGGGDTIYNFDKIEIPINATGGDPAKIQRQLERNLGNGLERATKRIPVPAQ